MLLKEAIKNFESQFPNFLIQNKYKEILVNEIVKPDTSDKNLKPLGSHYAIYDKETDKFYNRIKNKEVNAYTLLCSYYKKAIEETDIEKSFINLGWALHFVMDMNTIPHAIGLTDANLLNFIRKPHKKYEIYTQTVMEKYYKKIFIDLKRR